MDAIVHEEMPLRQTNRDLIVFTLFTGSERNQREQRQTCIVNLIPIRPDLNFITSRVIRVDI